MSDIERGPDGVLYRDGHPAYRAGSVLTGHDLSVPAGSRLVAQAEPGWYERLPRGDRHVPAYRDREDMPGPSRARLAQLVRQVRLLVSVVAVLVVLQPGVLYVLLTHR